MSSAISVVADEIVMQNIDEQAQATYEHTLPFTSTVPLTISTTTVHATIKYNEFRKHRNKQNAYADIQFIKEMEENSKIPSLDCLIARDKNCLRSTVKGRPTHRDNILRK